jgi:hypothetical protein
MFFYLVIHIFTTYIFCHISKLCFLDIALRPAKIWVTHGWPNDISTNLLLSFPHLHFRRVDPAKHQFRRNVARQKKKKYAKLWPSYDRIWFSGPYRREILFLILGKILLSKMSSGHRCVSRCFCFVVFLYVLHHCMLYSLAALFVHSTLTSLTEGGARTEEGPLKTPRFARRSTWTMHSTILIARSVCNRRIFDEHQSKLMLSFIDVSKCLCAS